ncbi:hypothetical protein IGB42_01969 [Andreprevotia sp. IGB-42]|uniref:hypothetical protein n=1 Tax=Andreprevotia sp. IGB-42 TaxID=2497473 RepID=UPI001358AA67|nr:hypothetical protein [Andreprevotia sp. IGB-42]KAF0813618.1 hypothetical protein IGB42_01969 [Andreprevotia sp. IGB-42]
MGNLIPLTELEEILSQYQEGLYTDGELVSFCLGLMGKESSAQVWGALPEWVRNRLIDQLRNFSDSDDIVAFGRGDAREIKAEMLYVKDWLMSRGLM